MAEQLQVRLVAADREVWTGEARMVTARTTDGDIGILPGHAAVRIADDQDGIEGVAGGLEDAGGKKQRNVRRQGIGQGFEYKEHQRQAVLALATMDADTPADTPTFLGYLAGAVLIPVAGVLWARTEVTRWAGTVLAVAGASVGVMVWRLLELWEATGA